MAPLRPKLPPNLRIRARSAHSGSVGRCTTSAAPASPDLTRRTPFRAGRWLPPHARPGPRPRRRPAWTTRGLLPRSEAVRAGRRPPHTPSPGPLLPARRRTILPARCSPEVVHCQIRPGRASLAVLCHRARMAGGAGHGRGTTCRARISSAGIGGEGEPAGPVAAHRPSGTASRTHGLSARMREHA